MKIKFRGVTIQADEMEADLTEPNTVSQFLLKEMAGADTKKLGDTLRGGVDTVKKRIEEIQSNNTQSKERPVEKQNSDH